MASLFGRGFNPLHLHKKRHNFGCAFFGGMGGLNLIIFYFFCPSISTKKGATEVAPFCVYDHILGLETAACEKKSCIFCFSPATMMMSSSWMMRLGSGLV